MRLSVDYKEKQAYKHLKELTWGAGGDQHKKDVHEVCNGMGNALDYGCGKGKLSIPIPHQRYDPCVPPFDVEPTPVDVVLCLDVLEHVEPDYVDDVLDHIQSLALRRAYFVISTRLARHTLSDGSNCHRTIKPMPWWLDKLGDRFDVTKAVEPRPTEGIVFCESRSKVRRNIHR